MSSTPSLPKRFRAELLGTFVFVLVGAGSAIGGASAAGANSGTLLVIAALGNGIGLAIAITATMKISGGALNPAVAVGLWAGGKLSAKDTLLYIVAEIVGALAAGVALVVSFPSALGNAVTWGAPMVNSSVSTWQAIAIEGLLTFVLVTAVYGTAVDSRAPHVGGFGIGLAVLADVLVAGNLTGAAMNPARAYGPMIAASFFPAYWYVYLIGPIIGGALAGVVYHYFIEGP